MDYTLTQGDIDAGTLHNTATIDYASLGGPITDAAEVETAIVGTDEIDLLKSAAVIEDTNEPGRTDAGDTAQLVVPLLDPVPS